MGNKQVFVSQPESAVESDNGQQMAWHETPDALRRPAWLMPFKDILLITGLVLLLLSVALFGGYAFMAPGHGSDPDLMLFFIHYGIAGCYVISLTANGGMRFWSDSSHTNRAARWVCLLLLLVSAFALNREVAVFRQSTDWLCGALVVAGAAVVAYAWTPYLGVRMQQLTYALLAAAFWLFVYAAVFVAVLYPISVLALLVLGMSIHTFVPALIAVALGRMLWADYRMNEHLRPAICIGFMLPLLITFLFLIAWSQHLSRIERVREEAVLRRTEDLPEWVLMAQAVDSGNPVTRWIMSRMLSVGTKYDKGPFKGSWGGLGELTAMDDVKQHDPLVVLANQLLPASGLTNEEKLTLLKAINNNRHQTEEKFWTGRHLTTTSVVTQARIWPQYRMAYTEKTVRIHNAAQRQTGEALYTFHLPAGAVVTSMSLWINGKEEKARLTTVAKADSAYRRVVDVESRPRERDPAVVYWQEGSRVTVRVFPCMPGEERQVKIGVTSALRLEDLELIYDNPWFEGPDPTEAQETIQVDFDQQPAGVSVPTGFDRGDNGRIRYQGNYKSDWSLRMKAPALSSASYVLDGVSYQLAPYQPKVAPFDPEAVYLDLNAAWSLAEFETVWRAVRHKPVYVFDDGLVQLTDANRAVYFERLNRQWFSLFPVYRIENPQQALLLTQSTVRSVFLNDLAGSSFAERLTRTAAKRAPIRTVSLSAETSGYLKTLAEFRAIQLEKASAEAITAGLGLQTFPALPDGPGEVVLPTAGVSCRAAVVESGKSVASEAPDHLARLYGYNHLMAGIGRHYFDASYRKNDALLAEAQQAHVLSPLSSLIVLETEHDYERFGIKKYNKGLGNATLKEEGAVPEPHEWAMIALIVIMTGWLWLRTNTASGGC